MDARGTVMAIGERRSVRSRRNECEMVKVEGPYCRDDVTITINQFICRILLCSSSLKTKRQNRVSAPHHVLCTAELGDSTWVTVSIGYTTIVVMILSSIFSSTKPLSSSADSPQLIRRRHGTMANTTVLREPGNVGTAPIPPVAEQSSGYRAGHKKPIQFAKAYDL